MTKPPLRLGMGGPVGLRQNRVSQNPLRRAWDKYHIAVITNDIYTKEDAEFLLRHEALDADRILGVETGGCLFTAIREDASMNLSAVEELQNRFGGI